jgi:hypothetical protein
MVKKKGRATYRVRPVWNNGSWVLRSPELENLLLYAPVLGHVAAYARQAIAKFVGERPNLIDVVVLPAAIRDAALHGQIEAALASQAIAKVAAQEAASSTFAASDVLSHAGMDMVDIGDLLGMTQQWHGDRPTRHSGIAALDDDPWLRLDDDEDDWGTNPWEPQFGSSDERQTKAILDALAAEVGGAAELAVVDDLALPDEEFVWDGIADDIWPHVIEVLALCDHACDALLGVEARTATRRALAQLARSKPAIFRRKASACGTAAALCWTIGKANHLFSPTASPRIGELGGLLGATGLSSRARTLMPAAGFEERSHNHIVVGSANLLVSAHRARIIELRDRYSSPAESEGCAP